MATDTAVPAADTHAASAPQPSPSSGATPVTFTERISAIDTLRGCAVLGILLMNIVAMGLNFGSYDDPTVAGGATGANLWVWAVLHVVAEGKMRALFSLIFGASMVLLVGRLDKRSGDGADIYYRRLLWLLLFGIVHAYLLWLGDILYPYALCGLFLYPFRHRSAKSLAIIGGVLLAITALSYVGFGYGVREMITKGRAAQALADQGAKLTADQKEELQQYEEWRKFSKPTEAEIQENNDAWRGSVLSVIKARAGVVFGFFHRLPLYHPMMFDIFGMMFLGMAALKLRLLDASRSLRFYACVTVVGYGIGLPVGAYSAWLIIKTDFDPVTHLFANSTYDLVRLSVCLGHLGLIMMLCKAGWLRWLTARLAAIGQTAFSNYIFQSVVTAFFFTGYGFGYYGMLERYQLYYVVGVIWLFQLILSPIWLRYFRFGPLEWGWRSLTYWKRQPMRMGA
ncbi:MAG: DUF418 domain-containing protein [Acidobacteriales bacterium]|nr:DUF418 domain-containing protein [Terriglobales bacterium]